MFDENTIKGIVDAVEREGCGLDLAMKLEADLRTVMANHRRRIERNRQHERVLLTVQNCGWNVTQASEALNMTRQNIYLHLHKQNVK